MSNKAHYNDGAAASAAKTPTINFDLTSKRGKKVRKVMSQIAAMAIVGGRRIRQAVIFLGMILVVLDLAAPTAHQTVLTYLKQHHYLSNFLFALFLIAAGMEVWVGGSLDPKARGR